VANRFGGGKSSNFPTKPEVIPAAFVIMEVYVSAD
jgi:hypothetical protein